MVNRVLRNTYFLLSLTLLFGATTATYASTARALPIGFIGLFMSVFGLYFLTVWLRNSAWGILAIFAYTGFLGYTLGPVLNFFICDFSNGAQIIGTFLGASGLIFLGLATYVLTTRKDFSYLGGFILVAIITAFLMSCGAMIFNLPVLQLIIMGAFTIISSAFVLYYTTRQIIQNGERNYIMATINLYMVMFDFFVRLSS